VNARRAFDAVRGPVRITTMDGQNRQGVPGSSLDCDQANAVDRVDASFAWQSTGSVAARTLTAPSGENQPDSREIDRPRSLWNYLKAAPRQNEDNPNIAKDRRPMKGR